MSPEIRVCSFSHFSHSAMWKLEQGLQELRDDGWVVRAMSSYTDKMWPHSMKFAVVLEREEGE